MHQKQYSYGSNVLLTFYAVLATSSLLSSSSAPHAFFTSHPIGLDSIPSPSMYSSAIIMSMPTLLTYAANHVICTLLCCSPTTTHIVSTSLPTFSVSSSTISSGVSYPLASTTMSLSKLHIPSFRRCGARVVNSVLHG